MTVASSATAGDRLRAWLSGRPRRMEPTYGSSCETAIANDPAANYDPPECSRVSMHLMHGGQKRFQRDLEKMTRVATVQSVSFVGAGADQFKGR
jgi:hypothetical protein